MLLMVFATTTFPNSARIIILFMVKVWVVAINKHPIVFPRIRQRLPMMRLQ